MHTHTSAYVNKNEMTVQNLFTIIGFKIRLDLRCLLCKSNISVGYVCIECVFPTCAVLIFHMVLPLNDDTNPSWLRTA